MIRALSIAKVRPSTLEILASHLPTDQACELRGDAVGQVDRNVIELSGSQMTDPDEDLEVRDGETAVREVLAAMRDEAALQLLEGVGKRPCGQPFALCLLFGRRQVAISSTASIASSHSAACQASLG